MCTALLTFLILLLFGQMERKYSRGGWMRSLLTDASSPALHPLGPPVKSSNEANASVVEGRRDEVDWEGQAKNAGTCLSADVFLHL